MRFSTVAAAGDLSGQLEEVIRMTIRQLRDFDPDDNLDVLQQASLLRQSAQDRTRSARRTKKATDKPEQEAAKQSDETKQSEVKDEASRVMFVSAVRQSAVWKQMPGVVWGPCPRRFPALLLKLYGLVFNHRF